MESKMANQESHKKKHQQARNDFQLYLYDRLKHFMQTTNGSNLAPQMKQFVNDVTDVALGKEKK